MGLVGLEMIKWGWWVGKKAIQAIRPTFARMKCAAAWNAFIAEIKSLLTHQPSRLLALHTPTSARVLFDRKYIVLYEKYMVFLKM